MNTFLSKSILAVTVAAGVMFGSTWASAGNLPKWGGATTTTQPQPVQQPRQPLVSEPAPIQTQTVQSTQPRTWTTQGTTSSPTITSPTQPRTFQLNPGTTTVKPVTEQISPTPETYNATGVQQSVTPVSFTMQVAPTVLRYNVNAQEEVAGDRSVAIDLQTVPAVGTNQFCEPRMAKAELYYRFIFPGTPRAGDFIMRKFYGVDLQSSQRCFFSVNSMLQLFAGGDPEIRARACGSSDQTYRTPTELYLQAKVYQVHRTTYANPTPGGTELNNAEGGWFTVADAKIPMGFTCEKLP